LKKQLDENAIPEEQPARQEIIPFYRDELAAAMTTGGDIYITLMGLCSAMGLSPRPQLRRMLRTPAPAKGYAVSPLRQAVEPNV
jgi:hypothetical protein